MGDKIGLTEVLDQLRDELHALTLSANDKDVRFALETIEVELHIGVTKQGTTGGKASFWVLELGAEGSYAKERTQTVKLTLRPRLEGAPAGSEFPMGR